MKIYVPSTAFEEAPDISSLVTLLRRCSLYRLLASRPGSMIKTLTEAAKFRGANASSSSADRELRGGEREGGGGRWRAELQTEN